MSLRKLFGLRLVGQVACAGLLCFGAIGGALRAQTYQLVGGSLNLLYQGTATIEDMPVTNRPDEVATIAAGAGPRNASYRITTGTTWSDAQAELAVTGTGKVKRVFDRVTLRLATSPVTTEERSWTGSAWVRVVKGTGAASGAVWSDVQANALFTGTTVRIPNVLVSLSRTGTGAAEETRYWDGSKWVAFGLADYFPAGRTTNGLTVAVILSRVSIGGVFAGGAPQYYLGDTILRPSTDVDGNVLAADSTYWRAVPVRFNESINQSDGTADKPQPTDNSLTYYYSEHANRVFATQPGNVTLVWVTSQEVRVTTPVADDRLRYRYRTDTFTVSPSTTKPVRKIFWTENGFVGPMVRIPNVVQLVEPIYTAAVPKTVDTEFRTNSITGELRTLWFDASGGIGLLRAFNRTGRVFVEYLGPVVTAGKTARQFLGADIVEIVQEPEVIPATAYLGQKLSPRDISGQLPPLEQDSQWLASSVTTAAADPKAFVGEVTRADGGRDYYAERTTENLSDVSFYWLARADAGIPAAPAVELNIFWPRLRNSYVQRWNPDVEAYAINTVAATGSPNGTGVKFVANDLPQLIFQDDSLGQEAGIDPNSQRFTVRFTGDSINRALLKFQNGSQVWYQPIYSVAEASSPVEAEAVVGQRINPPAGHSAGGYISAGEAYDPESYINPFAMGLTAAERGAILPVNAIPAKSNLKIWWFKTVSPPAGTSFASFHVPSTLGYYKIRYPQETDATPPSVIVLASNQGSGDLNASEAVGRLYIQNSSSLVGYNPNEEHALLKNGRVWALRDDLNVYGASAEQTASYTSEPFVLLRYISPADDRPAMRAFKVVRELDLPGTADDVLFSYPIVAGTIVQGPMPLPLLPVPAGSPAKESGGDSDPAIATASGIGTALKARYDKFTFQDRKGYAWVYRGPHGTGTKTFSMQFWYPFQAGFHVPGLEPSEGAPMPYLRSTETADSVGDPPALIKYVPTWPSSAPELRVGETLTLPKFGLPDVLNQASAEVFYDQSMAVGSATTPSVWLHDPVREKVFFLAPGKLERLPATILTTQSQGRTYFQGISPHLQQRFYFDPRRGSSGALVLVGQFVNEIVGEDYLLLNVLSRDDLAELSLLAAKESDDNIKDDWAEALRELSATVETYERSATNAGTMQPKKAVDTVKSDALVKLFSPESPVVDYALSTAGTGAGWVTLVFGNGEAFTPQGDPVSVEIIKVVPRLYSGELKVLLSSNPLDEKVTLRHTGDFAGKPDDYVFEWRYAQGSSTTPPVYELESTPREPLTYGGEWQAVEMTQSPMVQQPAPSEYTSASLVTLPPGRTVVVNRTRSNGGGAFPGLVLKSKNGVNFDSANWATGVPDKIVLSAKVAAPTGFVLYINDVAALAYNAPAPFINVVAKTGLVPTLPDVDLQFSLNPSYFKPGVNSIEVALFSTADIGSATVVNFRLHAYREIDRVAPANGQSTPWTLANIPTTTEEGKILRNQVVVGGNPNAPLGSPILVMSDNYLTMRYRPRSAANVAGAVNWSRWSPPVLVEGWVKRVLGRINPFNQRMSDLNSSTVNSDVSLLTQAGTRWEGNVALTLDNINNVGLIELYETMLNRAKAMSIESGIDDPSVNDALLLAAGYLNDLYTVLGNEAYADAANPTISIDEGSSSTAIEVNTSRYSFEGQVTSVLEEELALLRGRDDFLQPGVGTTPAYNRLYWNYTRGINSGEALYAINYNISEKVGSSTANGVLDAADAQRMFPQGHGDAYGHYLTALTGYYHLLRNSSFTWTPRSEAVNVLGKAVQIDYFDERKFAAAAANVARTAQQVVALTFRQAYRDEPLAGWSHFRDGKVNPSTGTRRDWGLDEWTSRATQGSYLHWMMGNALLPMKDTDPNHTGVQVVDRTTVPELVELAILGTSFQSTIDSANAHLNPLGLSPGAIAFDISSAALKAGESHYEQVQARALRALQNAKGSFDQAAKMTRMLRSLEGQATNQTAAIDAQERAFNRQLIEIYGSPYPGSIGAGKPYAQGYAGPDFTEWFVINRPSDLVDVSGQATAAFYGSDGIVNVTVNPSRLAQFAEEWRNGEPMGSRAVTGSLQEALLDEYEAQVAYRQALDDLAGEADDYSERMKLLQEMVSTQLQKVIARSTIVAANEAMHVAQILLAWHAESLRDLKKAKYATAEAVAETFPKVAGLANDPSFAARGALYSQVAVAGLLEDAVAGQLDKVGQFLDVAIASSNIALEAALDKLDFDFSQRQFIYENGLAGGKLVQSGTNVAQMATHLSRATSRVANLMVEGDRVRSELEIFRQRSAAIVQGYRTRDFTFRAFRNEALEQYRSLFDLASRYTYLAAKSYDYETGLLGSSAGESVINAIVSSRSLGDLSGGVPQATVSTLGDAGLAGTMARIEADWSAAKPRLGINNPDQNGTLFSLRRELFRLLDDPARTDDDALWQQTLEQYIMSNVLTDADVAAQCRNLRKPDGSAVPGIVIPFRTAIQHGQNFFGRPIADGDHTFSASNFATKIFSAGIVFRGYVGMDPYLPGSTSGNVVFGSTANALSATPYAYLIPTGTDYLRAPPLGDTDTIRGWSVADQAMPLPFNLGATAFSATQFFNANGTLTEAPWVLRKHQAFRPVSDPNFFYGSVPAEFTSSRLVGRSVWNSGWKLVIPAYMLYTSEQQGLDRFVKSVGDIQLFLRTYSHAGN